MKKFIGYIIALFLICVSLSIHLEMCAQFGFNVPDYDLKKEQAKRKEYKEKCRKVQNHNEWVNQEVARLSHGKIIGASILITGIGMLGIGICIKK